MPTKLLELYLLKINNKSLNLNNFIAGHNSGIGNSSGLMVSGFSLRISLMFRMAVLYSCRIVIVNLLFKILTY